MADVPHHSLRVAVDPEGRVLHVLDRLTFVEPATVFTFTANRQLTVSVQSPSGSLQHSGTVPGFNHLRRYTFQAEGPVHTVSILLQGAFPSDSRQHFAAVSPKGVYLDRYSGWFADTGSPTHRFELEVSLPRGWHLVSQGEGTFKDTGAKRKVVWRESHPQQDLYLTGGPLHRYTRNDGDVTTEVYLRTSDAEALAKRYLDATAEYLHFYETLLGDYPYAKFALVENFWESGYGMPSFTLLGSRVIRLPFIVHTSYPHEIVHNWWGNGVYVDASSGNWGEGLTAYLSDHLLKERAGAGHLYRRDSLQKYRSYVTEEVDFPLVEFRSKHDAASEAVGYNKSLMLFHMLRRKIGDEKFLAGLRALYAEHRHTFASFGTVRQVFESISGDSLEPFFEQWIRRVGAPELGLEAIDLRATDSGWLLVFDVIQRQSQASYLVDVPVVIDTGASFEEFTLLLAQRRQHVEIKLNEPPVALYVDPWFDVFRRLHKSEIPASLGDLFGADAPVAVLPANADSAVLQRYRNLAAALGIEQLIDEADIDSYANRAVWLLGWRNGLTDRLPVQPEADDIVLEDSVWSRDEHCVVLAAALRQQSLGWVGCDSDAAAAVLARKLPHYGKYSYVAFETEAERNVLKGRWSSGASAMAHYFTSGERPPSPLPARPSLFEPRP